MILAIPEYDNYPASPAQWDRFYHTLNDKIYIEVLAPTHPSYPLWEQMSTGAAVRDDMRHEITLVRSRYSAKDYQTFLDEMIAYIAEKWGSSFNDFMQSEPAMMIMEYVSAAFDQMSWYLDRETDDNYMMLARIRANVARMARYLGYKPGPAVSGSVDIAVTLPNAPYGFDVSLKEGHQFEGPNSLIFELASDQTIPAGNTSKTVGAYQGQSFTEVFISDGEPNQEFDLSLVPDGQFVALNKTLLKVALVEWDEEDFLPYGAVESYEVSYLLAPPRIRFGDGVIGKIPPAGSEIRVSYVATVGKTASLATSGTITKSLTPVVVNFQQIPITVTNPNPTTGGADAASMEEIKANAPKYFLAAERLVTEGDYNTLAGSYRGVSGAVAKAKATMIRGVEEDLELKGLIDALTADRQTLDDQLDGIKANQDSIKATTGDSVTASTVRYHGAQIEAINALIKAKTDDIDAMVSTVQENIVDCRADIDSARTQLDFMGFHELVGMGDGSTVVFAKTLAKRPITPGSVTVVVSDPNPLKVATDGDCDATPGRLAATMVLPGTATPAPFVAGDRGKTIRVGGEYRQIFKVVDGGTIEYSGPRIYGTLLLVDVLPSAIVGYDNGAGDITVSGSLSGSIAYANGSLTLTFNVAPDGIAGQFGVPIQVTYQYQAEGIKDTLQDADDSADTAATNTSEFTTYGGAIDDYADDSDTEIVGINTASDAIDDYASDTVVKANLAAVVPDQIQNDIDALYTYLDTIFSGNCKVNVARVSILVLDSNGFYAAPSLALIADAKAYLDARKIETVQNSVVSGAYYLVKVKLNIELAIEDQYVFKTVSEAVSAVMDTMLKGRAYGQALLRSEYYPLVEAVDGVDYTNIEIDDIAYVDSNNPETPPAVDSKGNLFIGQYETITKWEVNISQIG